MSVTLILGAERFLARATVDACLARAADREVSRYTGDRVALAEVLDEVRTPTLFGKPRLVLVEQAEKLLSGEALDALGAFAERGGGDARLILQATSLDRRFKAAKRLEAASDVMWCKPLEPRAVAPWIVQHAREAHGLQADAAAARELRARIGEDLGALDGALKRLKEQIAPRTRLQAVDVEDSTESHRSPLLFEASSALESRKLGAALAALDGAFRDGVRIHQDLVVDEAALGPILLSNLHRAYTKLVRFHLASQSGLSDPDAARQAGVSPRAASFFVQRARGWRLQPLVDGHTRFVAADTALKSGGSARRVLERLLLQVLGA